MLANKESETKDVKQKRSYSYGDLIKMQSNSAYTSIGNVIPSQKPSAARATFGLSQRGNVKKLNSQKPIMQVIVAGKEGNGPASYYPSEKMENGKVKYTTDAQNKYKYDSQPNFSIGKSPRKGGQQRPVYNYMHSKNDKIDINGADLATRNHSPTARIGTQRRFSNQRQDKIYPGPTYDPKLHPNVAEAPHYTLGSRRKVKGVDPLVPTASTTALVGPSSYFQKSKSTTSFNRIPYDSKIRNEPAVNFTKGPKSLATFKSGVDETYDLKTKTIMAHYDFEYDAGKGLNSGRAWEKKTLLRSSQMPLQKNKMKSHQIPKSTREIQNKRGTFVSTMSQVPATVRMSHPKF